MLTNFNKGAKNNRRNFNPHLSRMIISGYSITEGSYSAACVTLLINASNGL